MTGRVASSRTFSTSAAPRCDTSRTMPSLRRSRLRQRRPGVAVGYPPRLAAAVRDQRAIYVSEEDHPNAELVEDLEDASSGVGPLFSGPGFGGHARVAS